MADVFGRMVADYHADALVEAPIHRRDDGESWEAVLAWYFTPPNGWPETEREFLNRAEGRVLDLGCRVGRTSLYLKRRGHPVVGVDPSHGALAVARDRGVDRVLAGQTTRLGVRGEFDTLLVLGGRLGLPGSRFGVRKLLSELADLTPEGRLIADLTDPTAVEDPDRRSYLKRRTVGEGTAIRKFRVEYDGVAGPWVEVLFLSPAVFRETLSGTPWRLEAFERDADQYYVLLERE